MLQVKPELNNLAKSKIFVRFNRLSMIMEVLTGFNHDYGFRFKYNYGRFNVVQTNRH